MRERNSLPSRYKGILVATSIAMLAVTGCTRDFDNETRGASSSAPELSKSITKPAITAPTTRVTLQPVETAPAKTEKEKAFEYILSKERSDRIEEVFNKASGIIYDGYLSGKFGDFDFYNTETGNWGVDRKEAGYGHLQHNPQYNGGTIDCHCQLIISLPRDENGEYSPNEIDRVIVSSPGKNYIEIKKFPTNENKRNPKTNRNGSTPPNNTPYFSIIFKGTDTYNSLVEISPYPIGFSEVSEDKFRIADDNVLRHLSQMLEELTNLS